MHSTKDAKEAEFPSQDSVTNSQNIREREREEPNRPQLHHIKAAKDCGMT